MHDGVKWDNDLQREAEFRNNQHQLRIDGEPLITAFAATNRPTSVHRLGVNSIRNVTLGFVPPNSEGIGKERIYQVTAVLPRYRFTITIGSREDRFVPCVWSVSALRVNPVLRSMTEYRFKVG